MFKQIFKPAMKLEEYQRRDNDPNCTVPLGEFATMCANINCMSAVTVTIQLVTLRVDHLKLNHLALLLAVVLVMDFVHQIRLCLLIILHQSLILMNF